MRNNVRGPVDLRHHRAQALLNLRPKVISGLQLVVRKPQRATQEPNVLVTLKLLQPRCNRTQSVRRFPTRLRVHDWVRLPLYPWRLSLDLI